VKEDRPVHADAIVVLMGSNSDRVLQATDLYNQGLASNVIIVEPTIGGFEELKARGVYIISGAEQATNALVTLGIPPDSIITLPGDATSTKTEAMIIRAYLRNKPSIDTIFLVSSAPHTRRASMVFKDAFRLTGMKVYVICSPSIYSGFNAKKWWESKKDILEVLSEYIKIVNFVLFERRELKVEQVNMR
jgi:uncharacterized SAM-binding protein YcdF (DUF218 family)